MIKQESQLLFSDPLELIVQKRYDAFTYLLLMQAPITLGTHYTCMHGCVHFKCTREKNR